MERREGFVSSGGVELHYVDLGPADGELVVFLHGLTANVAFYEPLLSALSGPFRVIGLDLRGHGLSARPPTGYTLAHLSGDVRALVEHLGLSSYAVAGHCLGSLIAFYHAAHYPGAVRALVALEVPSPVIRPILNQISCISLIALARITYRLGDPRREIRFVMALASLLPGRPGRTLRWWLSSNIVPEGPRGPRWAFSWRAVAEIMRGLMGLDIWRLARSIRCPALLVRGSRGLFWASDARRLAELLPEAEVFTIPRAGHVLITSDLDLLTSVMRRFLSTRWL